MSSAKKIPAYREGREKKRNSERVRHDTHRVIGEQRCASGEEKKGESWCKLS
jgi:hypothetical protein